MTGKIENYKMEALGKIGMKILKKNPEAIAVTFAELDCGCMMVGGTSANGDPVGSAGLIHIASETNDGIFICSKCNIIDKDLIDRIIRQGIMWKKGNSEKPNEKQRNAIRKKVYV